MSGGGGGFYKYRCKYFYTHNCPNWVYAEGRDSEVSNPSVSRYASRDIFVPKAADGMLCYTMMEMVNIDEASSDWSLRYKPTPKPTLATVTTSATPNASIISKGL
ncbi:hypothetical protein G7054_g7275 [Neopestalotiopsis clavispora]|nr:hypothetical protein G7054_g7275 [Neopestalotiopsis clavispora]